MMLADARQIDPNGKDLEAAHVGVEGVSCAERFFDQLQPYVVVASQSGGGVPGMEAIGDHLRGAQRQLHTPTNDNYISPFFSPRSS